MPGATLHLTHGELLAADGGLAAPLGAAMLEEARFTRLGSVFIDLPFYTSFVPMMLGYWLEIPAEYCPFAQRIHRHHPDLFAWYLIRQLARDGALSRAKRLAFMGGVFGHMALDMELHPLVNWCARREVLEQGGSESHHHRLTEKYHSLFFHREILGEDILGTWRVFSEKTRIVDFPAFFGLRGDEPVVRWAADLLWGFHGSAAPGPRQLARWIRAFRHFSFSICLPIAAENSNRLGNAENRARYFENRQFRFMDFWERARRRSVTLCNLAFECFEAAERKESMSRSSFLDRAGIANLADPACDSLPALAGRSY